MKALKTLFIILTLSLLGYVSESAETAAGGKKNGEKKPEKKQEEKEKEEKLLPMHKGVVRDFLILAGIPYSINPKGINSPNFIDGETKLLPREGYAFKSEKMLAMKPLQWKKCSSATDNIALKPFGAKKETMNYAVTYLVIPRFIKEVILNFNTNKKGSWLIINGKVVRPRTKVPVREGRNTILIRIPDGIGDSSFTLSILDGKNAPLPDKAGISLSPLLEDESLPTRKYIEPDNAFIIFPKSNKRISYVLELLTPEGEAVLKKSIQYIIEAQQPNGAWSDTMYPDSVGVSALCCMALLAEGNLPRVGPHGKALDKGIEFLLSSYRKEGVFASKKVEGYGVMYGHSLTLLTLMEICGNMPWRPDIYDKISKGLQTILSYQRLDGGWRYELTTTGASDISTTTTVLWTLGQARRYGFTIPKARLERAIKFVGLCGRPDGRFMYRLSGKAKVQPHSGVGVSALYGAGRVDHPLLPAARDRIAFEYQRYSIEDLGSRRNLMYGSFFASMAMYSSGYDYWSKWYPKIIKIFASIQKKDGEIYDHMGNKVYTTALGAIILQAPYGYLSIYVQ